jgi:S-adenosylmethionine hydrolase
MIALLTDFGPTGPYVGQLHAVVAAQAPGIPVIDLFHDLPRFDVRAAAYLIPAYTAPFPRGSVVVCVVDPGVGGARRPVFLDIDGVWYVGPDNGLFSILVRRATRAAVYEIRWRPAQLSVSFHARDLFTPVAVMLARGERPDSAPVDLDDQAGAAWPDDLAEVLYVDGYGNAITGLRAIKLGSDARLQLAGTAIAHALVFSMVSPGTPFWYENSSGLVEIAQNRGHAAQTLGIGPGSAFRW